MERSEILNLENRRKIYNYIRDNPGLHLRELSRRLNIAYYNLDYHIRYLKKLELLEIRPDKSYNRVYVSNSIGKNQKEIINILRHRIPRLILIFMSVYPISTKSELSKHIEKHPTTINFHIKKLVALDLIEIAESKNGIVTVNHPLCNIVERSKVTNETLYKIKDYALIKKMFISHKKSLSNDKDFKFAIKWLQYISSECKMKRKGKKIKSFKSYSYFQSRTEKRIQALLNEMFPHPYHLGSHFF